MILELFEKVLYVNVPCFSIVYASFLLLIGAFSGWYPLPPSYFSNTENDIDTYFTNNVPFLMLFLLLPFVFCLNLVYGFGKFRNTMMPVIRVIISFIIVYFIAKEFWLFGSVLDKCTINDVHNNDIMCTWNNYTLLSFEVTSRTFRGVFSLLTLIEEISYYKLWRLVETIADENPNVEKNKALNVVNQVITAEDRTILASWYLKTRLFLTVNFIALFILILGIHLSNLLIMVYFPYILEHVVAITVALILWFLCYRLIYPLHDSDPGIIEIHRQIRMEAVTKSRQQSSEHESQGSG